MAKMQMVEGSSQADLFEMEKREVLVLLWDLIKEVSSKIGILKICFQLLLTEKISEAPHLQLGFEWEVFSFKLDFV